MKKYAPMKMIGKSRFVNYYNSWQEDKAALLGRMERLISENREYADKKNYGHLCNLITSLAMVMILEEKGHAREEAVRRVADAMYEFIKPQIASMNRLASHGWFVPFLKAAMPVKFKNTLGHGWAVDFPKCGKNEFSMVTHQCIYQQLFSKYNMPEMTAVFCKVDDILYGKLPRAEFLYTQQIGTGGSMCDYTFKKR